MKTFIADIIPSLRKYSQNLDNLTLLQNQHWVVIDEIESSRNVYIFRPKKELLISHNGKVEKAHWEYLGNSSLLIDRKNESYLFKHGFFDDQILALKVDSKEEYAILVNESKVGEDINSLEKVSEFLTRKYCEANQHSEIRNTESSEVKQNDFRLSSPQLLTYLTNKGEIQIEKVSSDQHVKKGMRVFQKDTPAPGGKYKLDFMWHIHIEDGLIKKISNF